MTPAGRLEEELRAAAALRALAPHARADRRVAAIYAARAAAIRQAYAAGVSVGRIAAALGCPRRLVYNVIREWGDGS